jgi:N-acetylmuramoyl-L-alanine amidase
MDEDFSQLSCLLANMRKRRSSVSLILICCLAACLLSCASTRAAAASKDLYFEAERCYKSLRHQPEKMKYRGSWLACIEKFEAAYHQAPAGPWAPAALYMTGVLYEELHGHSHAPEDREKARTVFERIIRDYPKSAYRVRSSSALRDFEPKPVKPVKQPVKPVKQPVTASTAGKSAGEAARIYAEADRCHARLLENPEQQKFRSYWETCIEKFEKAHDLDPAGPLAPAASYMTAYLYDQLHQHSFNDADRHQALTIYRQTAARYPESEWGEKARAALGSVPGDRGDVIKAVLADQYDPAEDIASGSGAAAVPGVATVTGIRFWSNPEYSRVVIDADREAVFESNLLKKDPSINQNHQRLYVDLKNSRLGDVKKMIPIHDSLLELARAGQYTADKVRVVVDINSFESYNVFSLQNPFRIVIDVRGKSAERPVPPGSFDEGSVPGSASIARQLALGVGRVVIDPGHGGKDYGAPGIIKGVHEKDVNLAIAKRLAEEIRRELGCEVILTRDTDRYLALEERTAIANTERADLFISIHANASRNHLASGIETYFLNLTTDEESIAVAARENATSRKNISELQTILNDLLQNAKINESSRLATYVQKNMITDLTRNFDRINDKGVKQAPFYVLIGAQMPAILVETAFISNKMECARLVDSNYQETLVRGIVAGIRHYINETRPTAYFGPTETDGPGG